MTIDLGHTTSCKEGTPALHLYYNGGSVSQVARLLGSDQTRLMTQVSLLVVRENYTGFEHWEEKVDL